MSEVTMVEGGPPIGMPIGDPNYPLWNTRPYVENHYGFTPDPNVTRRTITSPHTDVTPQILRGRERWVLDIKSTHATLIRVEPPANPDDPVDSAYAHQLVTPLQEAVIHTPPDIVAAHPYTPIKSAFPTQPIRQPMECHAAWFSFRSSTGDGGQDIAKPDSGNPVPKGLDALAA